MCKDSRILQGYDAAYLDGEKLIRAAGENFMPVFATRANPDKTYTSEEVDQLEVEGRVVWKWISNEDILSGKRT